MIRKLAKKLSAFENFVDDVVAEIKFFYGNFEEDTKILKNRRNLKIIQVSTSDAKILVKLMTPQKNFEETFTTAKNFQNEKNLWKNFSAEEVFNFVEEVGDKNKIHKISRPIVPGLLILETLLTSEKIFPCKILEMRFKNFITVGENLTLEKIDENNFEIKCGDSTKILMKKYL